MAGRQGRRSSTPRLAGWAILMFLIGIGLGTALTYRGCSGKRGLPGEAQTPARPAPRRTPPAAQAPPPVPAPVKSQSVSRIPAGDTEKPAPAPPGEKGLPRVALVIDDLGYAPPELVTRLCAQPVPFDVAVLPYQEFTRQSAEIAHGQGKEVMLHLPMEPRGYPGPGKDPGPDAVMFDLTEAQVRERVRKAMADIPYRKGVNNHMGSRITPDQARMTWVLEEVKARQCFFVDSRTEKDSVAFDVARDLALPTIQRKVFLDDDKAAAAINRQWQRMLGLAKAQGQVLAIGHIYPETVAELEKLIPAAKGQVTFVYASALAK
jgi:polysaccharide deacetylase 2 family uncharacterized protein YibQ